MPIVLQTDEARTDLDEIWDYIASDNPAAADKLIDRIVERCDLLKENPESGTVCSVLVRGVIPTLRFISLGNYVIFYAPIEDGILVYRVIHGARDIQQVLDGLKP